MRLRKFCCFLLFSAFCLFIPFSSMSAKAIDPADMMKLSLDMFRGMLGDSISGQYLGTDGNMHSITFSYLNKNTNNAQTNMLGYSAADWSGYMLGYTAPVPADFYAPAPSSGEHSVLFISPNLHYQNITYFKFGMTWLNSNSAWQSAYNTTPYTNFTSFVYLHAGDSLSDTYSLSRRSDNTMGAVTYNSLSSSVNPFLGFSDEGNWSDFYLGDIYISPIAARSNNSNYFYIFFVTPTVNSDYLYAGHGTAPSEPEPSDPEYSGDSATVTGTISDNGDGTQDVNISIEQDNSGLIAGIINGIKNLFIPSEDQLSAFSDDMSSLLEEHLGGLYEAVDLIEDQYDAFGSVTAKTELYVPSVSLHLLGNDTFSVGDWHVPLKVSDSRFDFVYTSLAFIIDFLATVAFVNMCRRKLEIFLNPESEVITDDS